MKKTKLSYIFCLSLVSFVLLVNLNELRTKALQPTINLNKYNAISRAIDSLNILISKEEQMLTMANKQIENQKADRIRLTTNCDTLKKSTLAIHKDSLSKSFSECDTLSNILKRIDKRIKKDSESISKLIKSLKELKDKTNTCKEQLQNESKSIVLAANKYSGSLQLKFKGIDYNIFIATTDSHEIKMYWQNKGRRNYASIRNLLNFLTTQKTEPLMITNAGMYTPDLIPQGLYIEHFGKELLPLDLKSPKTDANFYLKPNGVFFIDTFGVSHIETTEDFQKMYDKKHVAVEYATQSGPMLLINGSVHDSFTKRSNNKKIRSGVGIMAGKRTVFAISIDETNFYDFAVLFKDIFGCKDALFLDGAISHMYLRDIAPNELGGQFGAMISVLPKTKVEAQSNEKK